MGDYVRLVDGAGMMSDISHIKKSRNRFWLNSEKIRVSKKQKTIEYIYGD